MTGLGLALAAPPHLARPGEPALYGTLLAVLLALFVLRVLGQVVVALARPRWLPPMREWYSGLLPYRFLLPVQVVFIAAMAKMTFDVRAGGVGWAAPRPGLGAVLVWLSFVYAAAMIVRLAVWLRRPPERRRAWIPIPFHLVLAAFLFVFGSWHLAGGGGTPPDRAQPSSSRKSTEARVVSTSSVIASGPSGGAENPNWNR